MNAAAFSDLGTSCETTASLGTESLACDVVDIGRMRRQREWRRLIEDELPAWLAPARKDELIAEGLEPPSDLVVLVARQLALRMEQDGSELPTRIAPDGDGGFVFELDRDGFFTTLEIEEHRVLHSVYIDCELAHQREYEF